MIIDIRTYAHIFLPLSNMKIANKSLHLQVTKVVTRILNPSVDHLKFLSSVTAALLTSVVVALVLRFFTFSLLFDLFVLAPFSITVPRSVTILFVFFIFLI